MVRQARNYMVGAMSGAGLIAAAVVAFVLLVSALVFAYLPGLGLVDGTAEASVSAAGSGVAGATTGPGAANAGAAGGSAKDAANGNAAGSGAEGVCGRGQQVPGSD